MKQTLKSSLMVFGFFFRIGWFTFGGGWSILAQMEREFVIKKSMITKEELLDITSVGRSLPGVMITNISWIFGYKIGGVLCALSATIGMVLPSMIILSVVVKLYNLLQDNLIIDGMLEGIGSAVIPIILCSVLSLGKTAMRNKWSYLLCVSALLVSLFTSISNVFIILCAVILGIIKTEVK